MRTIVFLLLFAGSVSANIRENKRPYAPMEEWSLILPPKPELGEDEFLMTSDTVIIVDGKKTDKIPEDAEVVQIDLAKDSKTILRIKFKTKGKK